VRTLEQEINQLFPADDQLLTEANREHLLTLGRDLARAWDSPGATAETRKKIIRMLISEIVVDVVGEELQLIIHWQGGDHTRLIVRKNRVGHTRWTTDADVVDLVRVLARQMPDESIAAVLNRAGKSTGRGNSWTRARVCSLRHHQEVAPYREGERDERGEATLEEAAEALGVSKSTVRRMISDGILPGEHMCKGAPWIIRQDDLKRFEVRRAAEARRSRCPASDDPRQNHLICKEIVRWAVRSASVRPCEEVVLASPGDGAQSAFHGVVVDFEPAVITEAHQCFPLSQSIAHGHGGVRFLRKLSQSLFEPLFQ
jgi:excisionase family DNA binding protein